MTARPVCFFLLALLLCASPALATETKDNAQPNFITLGFGGFDALKNTPRVRTYDMRFEYRFGTSLISDISPASKGLDQTFQIHPFIGTEATPKGQTYSFAGLLFDVFIGKHFVLTPNLALGYYGRGEGKKLGYPLEFRSTMEAGFRFDNAMRLTGYFGHTSNASLGRKNPGAEEAGVYWHIPMTWF